MRAAKISILLCVFCTPFCAWACTTSINVPIYQNANCSFDERTNDLVSRMTLDEKISQMMNAAPAIPRLGIPAYEWWNEALHA